MLISIGHYTSNNILIAPFACLAPARLGAPASLGVNEHNSICQLG